MPPSGDRKQRWTAAKPCPVCGGYDRAPRGRGERCGGFLSSDGEFAYCTREDYQNKATGYSEKAQAWYHAIGPREAEEPKRKRSRGTYDRHYDYLDEAGELLFQVVRTKDPKGFYQRARDPKGPGGWRNSIEGTRRVPFGLPAILEADPDAWVWVVEGEKDVLKLVSLGLVATCNPGGAEKWGLMDPDAVRAALGDRSVVIVPDNDQPGRRHARLVAEALDEIAADIKILDLFAGGEWPEKADVTDWINAKGAGADPGAIAAELGELAFECPGWTPELAAEQVREEQAAEWGPLELGKEGPVAAFPVDVFPLPVRDLCVEASRIMSMPLDFFAAAVLATVAGAIGRTRSIRFKGGWIEPPSVYIGLVGAPGQGKTPALNLITRPLWQIAHECLDAYKEEKKAAEEAAKRAAKAAAEQGKKRPETSAESEMAPPQRILLSDTTVEALAVRLRDNPRGLVIARDELSAWMAGLNQYRSGGKGNDRQFYLEVWSSKTQSVDRKGQADGVPIYVPHPCLSLIGGIQPEVIRDQFAEQTADDGFIDRFLFVAPARTPRYISEDEVPGALMGQWTDAVRRLWESLQLLYADNGDTTSKAIPFSEEARKAFIRWSNEVHFREPERDEFPVRLTGVWTKLNSYCGRIALQLELLRYATAFEPGEPPEEVSLRSFEDALRVIDYFKSHASRVHGMIRGYRPDDPNAEAIVNWIRREKRARWKLRDLKDNLRCRFQGAESDLNVALRWLEDRNAIRPSTEAQPAGKPGRKSMFYETHPHLLGDDK